jgi:hypothetical protein
MFDKFLIKAKKVNSRIELIQISKIATFGYEMLQNTENIALRSLHILYMLVLRAEIVTIFEPKMVTISAPNI